ncbi:MAG: tRNA (adenosine(37)-N6)-threonylcarbamoyltransferase complex dimerization subunit type 1 TsaB [Desulfopila sp.]|jgi:tRNA threonylcarbamoyladenosine biosynthesis protein TsaB|nr:tRNA (adenosine(37)-N6)-threonylcarbamoyltransferase complex dimerization subunit type 1 TsaB [Desulfopila sp.]
MAGDYPLIVSFDTATKCSSVALSRGTLSDGEVLACLSLSTTVTHSRRLVGSVDFLFQETGTDWANVEAVAVGLGPGSFTGLRIGMATAKGFAGAGGKKLIGVPTLDALAALCLTTIDICVVLDARKKQIYSALYRHEGKDGLQRKNEVRVLTPEQLVADIQEPTLMVGDGVQTYGDYWKKELGNLVTFAPAQLHQPSAGAVGLLGGGLLEKGVCLNVASATPLYVRASDAELSLKDKRASAGETT